MLCCLRRTGKCIDQLVTLLAQLDVIIGLGCPPKWISFHQTNWQSFWGPEHVPDWVPEWQSVLELKWNSFCQLYWNTFQDPEQVLCGLLLETQQNAVSFEWDLRPIFTILFLDTQRQCVSWVHACDLGCSRMPMLGLYNILDGKVQ